MSVKVPQPEAFGITSKTDKSLLNKASAVVHYVSDVSHSKKYPERKDFFDEI